MLTRATERRLAEDVQLWLADGVISPATAALLRKRYGSAGFGWSTLVKYLGISGGLLAFLGLLGFVAVSAGSQGFGGVLLGAVGSAGLAWGVHLGRDAQDRYALSSKVITALGAAGVGLGVGLLCSALELSSAATLVVTGAFVVPLLALLAYRYKNPFLLIVAVLGFFHWVGTWDRMWSHSTYELEIDNPKLMTVAALLVFALGYVHERALQARTLRFYRVYQALGLFYANMSLLILSIDGDTGRCLPWVLVETVFGVAQILLGARLQNSLVLGFGVTSLAVDLFTRYYEHFWNQLDKGLFFLLGGAVSFAVGLVLERSLPRNPPGEAS